MHRICLVVVIVLCGLASVSYAQEAQQPEVERDAFHLYLLIGQSNMAGRGVPAERDKTAHPRVFMLNKQNAWVPAVEPLHFDKPGMVGVGPGLAFGKAMAEANPDAAIGLIPCAVGGSPISVWKPHTFYSQTGVYPYDDALKRCRAALKRGVLKGVLWHQGESDSNTEDGPLYQQRLTELIARLRRAVKNPNLPFVAGMPAEAFVARKPESKLVTDATKAAAKADKNVHWVTASGLTCKADRVHFNTESARKLGHRYAEAVLKRKDVTDSE